MQKLIALAIVGLFAFAALPSTEAAGTQTTEYVTARSGAQAAGESAYPGSSIWCAEGGHQYTPIGSPQDYQEADPTTVDPDHPGEAQENYTFETLGWSISGEPECLAGDVVSGNGDSGLNAAAYSVSPDEFGETITISITDTNFDSTLTYFVNADGDIANQGCGSIEFVIPDDLGRHWQSTVEDPRYILWVRIVAVHMNGDTLETCFGSTGSATAVWS